MMTRAFLAAAISAGVLLAHEARASHYDLSAIDLVTPDVASRLAGAKILTTEDLWNATATARQVSKLSRAARIPAKALRELHDLCDLLRLDGVGPKLARVLTLSGVRNLKALARQDPAKLTEKIKLVNAQHEILGKLPDQDSVGTWIARARELSGK